LKRYFKRHKMRLYIKNMVCNRCIATVKSELDRIGIEYDTVKLGEINTMNKLTPLQKTHLSTALQKSGFELIDEQVNGLIEKLKDSIIDLEKYSDEDLKTSFSDFISLSLKDNFISLNKLFAEIEGVTIEKYIISRKIEIVKELLVYGELSLAEIAHKMHYSNSAQFSLQFKKVTGLTPSHFRQLRHSRMINPKNN